MGIPRRPPRRKAPWKCQALHRRRRGSSRRRVFKRAGGKGNRSLCCPLRLHDPRGDLAAQPFEAKQRVGAGLRDLDALGGKVLAEKFEMPPPFLELTFRPPPRKTRT